MRKAFLLSAVAASALLTAPAPAVLADVFVFGTVTKFANFTVIEDVDIRKVVTIDVDILDRPEKFAEAATHYNQRNDFNFACENCAEKLDSIINSINLNVGITSVNQSSGNNNNQATVISFAFDRFTGPTAPPEPPPTANSAFAHSQVAGEQIIDSNFIDTVNIVFRDAVISDSINGNTGITAVNQAAGNINNQANAISIAVSLGSGVSLSDAALGQFVTNNVHIESSVSKLASTRGSINDNRGIVQVNQSAGNLGNQSNNISLAVTFAGSP